MQIIEAMVLGVIVIGAVAFAVTFQAPPPPSSSGGSEDMQEVTWDAIDAVNDLHYPNEGFANSSLSKGIAEAAAGDSQRLVESLGAFLPTGSQYNVYLNNGYDRLVLYEARNHTGETVGTAYPVQPDWRYHYGAPDLEIHDSNTSANTLGLTLVPLFNSNHVIDEGNRMKVSFEGVQHWAPGTQVSQWLFDREGENDGIAATTVSFYDDSYAHLVQGDTSVSYPSATIYMECLRDADGDAQVDDIEPCYVLDASHNPYAGYAPSQENITESVTGDSIGWYKIPFVVHNDGPGELPAGTRLTIDLPVGMKVQGTQGAGFSKIVASGSGDGPWTVRGELTSALSAGADANITVNLTTEDTRYAFKTITATLGDGAVSRSNLVVRVEEKTQGIYTGGDRRLVHVSGPSPAGSGASPVGRWGVVLTFPYGAGDVTWMNVTLAEGGQHFDSVSWPSDFNPTWPGAVLDGSVRDGTLSVLPDKNTVQWTKSQHRIPGYAFVEIQFELTTDGTLTEASPKISPARPKGTFTGYTPPPQGVQIEPGIWWREYPPSNGAPGYGMSSTGEQTEPRTITNSLAYRNADITGKANYTLSTIGVKDQKTGGLKDALHAARLYPDQQRVAVGETVSVTLESRDLATYVADEIGLNTLSLETNIYAPWGIRDGIAVATYDHEAASAPTAYALDLLGAYLDGNSVEDVVVASSDGNIYGMDGNSGTKFAGFSFSLPESSNPLSPSEPTALSRSNISGLGHMYAVATSKGIGKFYVLDEDLNEIWSASKPEGTTATLGVNTSVSLDGDAYPEVIASFKAEDVAVANAHGNSRLKLYSGKDDGTGQGVEGDGTGDVFEGWESDVDGDPGTSEGGDYGVVLNGTSDQLGLGKVGPGADHGVFANTGAAVGTSDLYTAKSALASFQSGDVEQTFEDANEFTLSVKDTGLKGLYSDGREAWNYTGGRFVKVMRSDVVDTGGAWTGLLAGGYDGWVYGMNASKAIYPVDGWQLIGGTKWTDISMANSLEGYAAETDGRLYSTRSGWTDMYTHRKDLGGNPLPSTRTHPGVKSVDTPEAPYLDDDSRISWWVGDAGMVLRSTDRLRTVDTMSTTAMLEAVIDGDVTALDLSLLSLESLDLSLINWEDVYAVDDREAWFVGGGVPGTPKEDYGYIGHTGDGGDTIVVTRLECTYAMNETSLDKCHLHDIGHDGENLWVVGEYGTVLVQDLSGEAFQTRMQDARMIGNGSIEIDLHATEDVQVKRMRVDWSPTGNLEWMGKVQLDTGSSNGTLWNRTHGEDYVTSPLTNYNSQYGAARNAILDVQGFATTESGAETSWSGASTLTVGPFRTTLAPTDPDPLDGETVYFNKADYTDDEIGEMDFPINFTVNVTYNDDSRDFYHVNFNETGALTIAEVQESTWQTPSDIGISSPGFCFGRPYEGCTSLHGINITDTDANAGNNPTGLLGGIVGTPQALDQANDTAPQPFLFRIEDATVTKVWDRAINQTYRDLAVNMADNDKWIIVGDDGRVATSYDKASTWVELPGPGTVEQDPNFDLYTVDWSHPTVGYIGGGAATGLQLTLNGYTEWGRITTAPLKLHGGGNLTTPIERIDVNGSEWTNAEVTTGEAQVSIRVHDPGLNSGQGGWARIYNSTTGWRSPYNFTTATSDVKLDIELTTPKHQGFSRFSPMVRGELRLDAYEDKAGSPDHLLSFDTNDTSMIASGMDTIDHEVKNGHGFYRLRPAENIWVHKLGNWDEGDWVHAASRNTGARVADMETSADGATVYVGTEGIYQWGADASGTPVAVHNVSGDVVVEKPSAEEAVENGTHHFAYDNTLYAIDAATGMRVADWNLTRFDDPILDIEVGDDAVFVITGDDSDPLVSPRLWRVQKSDQSLTNDPQFTSSHQIPAMTTAKIWALQGTNDDVVLSKYNTETDSGVVQAHPSPSMGVIWNKRPNLKGEYQFSYEVPKSGMYGAYLIVTEIRWDTLNDPNKNLFQTARIHNSFTVTPPTGEIPVAPTYNLEVVSWLEDWG